MSTKIISIASFFIQYFYQSFVRRKPLVKYYPQYRFYEYDFRLSPFPIMTFYYSFYCTRSRNINAGHYIIYIYLVLWSLSMTSFTPDSFFLLAFAETAS